MSERRLTIEELREMGYCVACLKKIRFEDVKYVNRPYKIPIERKGV